MNLLPNIRELTLGKTPYHCYSLRWRVNHGFKALRRFVAWPCDGKLEWPQGPQDLFSTVLAGGKVEFLSVAWSGCALPKEEPDEFDVDPGPIPILLKPKSTSIRSLKLSCCTFTKDEMSIILYVPLVFFLVHCYQVHFENVLEPPVSRFVIPNDH